QSTQSDPLSPSRLLLACDDETLVRRVKRLCGKPDNLPTASTPIGFDSPPVDQISQFRVPAIPPEVPLIEQMSVTDFRLYLDCPYRFALRKLLSLEPCEDSALELDPRSFGSLAHNVLCEFGMDGDASGSEDA